MEMQMEASYSVYGGAGDFLLNIKSESPDSDSIQNYCSDLLNNNRTLSPESLGKGGGIRRKPFSCDACPSMFGSKMELEEHQNSHTGHKPFECDVCKARFNRRSTLWNHKRIHSDTKPFTCPVCHMTFKWKNSLKCHTEMHLRKQETPTAPGGGTSNDGSMEEVGGPPETVVMQQPPLAPPTTIVPTPDVPRPPKAPRRARKPPGVPRRAYNRRAPKRPRATAQSQSHPDPDSSSKDHLLAGPTPPGVGHYSASPQSAMPAGGGSILQAALQSISPIYFPSGSNYTSPAGLNQQQPYFMGHPGGNIQVSPPPGGTADHDPVGSSDSAHAQYEAFYQPAPHQPISNSSTTSTPQHGNISVIHNATSGLCNGASGTDGNGNIVIGSSAADHDFAARLMAQSQLHSFHASSNQNEAHNMANRGFRNSIHPAKLPIGGVHSELPPAHHLANGIPATQVSLRRLIASPAGGANLGPGPGYGEQSLGYNSPGPRAPDTCASNGAGPGMLAANQDSYLPNVDIMYRNSFAEAEALQRINAAQHQRIATGPVIENGYVVRELQYNEW